MEYFKEPASLSQVPFHASQLWNNIVTTFLEKCPRGRHSRFLTHFDNSFTGREAISFILDTFPINPYTKMELTKEQAVKMLQSLLSEKIFVKIGGKKNEKNMFRDGSVLYCFKENEMKEICERMEEDILTEEKEIEEVKTPPNMGLNKVDVWNIYSSCFFHNLSEMFSSLEVFFQLNIQGRYLQRNIEDPFSTDPFPVSVMDLIRYLQKLPFSPENPNIMKALNVVSNYFERQQTLLTEDEAICLLSIFDETKKKTLLNVVSLLFLTLSPVQRRKLQILLGLMRKISFDHLCGLDTVLERFSKVIVPCNMINPKQALAIVPVLMNNVSEIFTVDEKLLQSVEDLKIEKCRQRRIALSKEVLNLLFPLEETKKSEDFSLYDMLEELKEEEMEIRKEGTTREEKKDKRTRILKRFFIRNHA